MNYMKKGMARAGGDPHRRSPCYSAKMADADDDGEDDDGEDGDGEDGDGEDGYFSFPPESLGVSGCSALRLEGCSALLPVQSHPLHCLRLTILRCQVNSCRHN